jgi:GTP cyclohydrolase I
MEKQSVRTQLLDSMQNFVVMDTPNPDRVDIQTAVRSILLNIGEDPERQGLYKTPERVARMYDELTAGYHTDPVKLVNGALFDVDYDEMVLVRNIEYYSLCEHHMLPFYGHAHVAYIPNGKVIGLSKIPRVVDMYARRLQVQERLTAEIAHFLEDVLHPRGVAVVVDGAHMCAMMRGVKNADTNMTTSSFLGEFKLDHDLRRDFLAEITRPRVNE